jgi:hypothetical protein
MKIHIARVVAAFWLLVLSLTSLTLAQTPAQTNPATSSNVTTTGGTVNAIPLFTTATNIQSSILTQTGTTGLIDPAGRRSGHGRRRQEFTVRGIRGIGV